jgi:hypothetical protein
MMEFGENEAKKEEFRIHTTSEFRMQNIVFRVD